MQVTCTACVWMLASQAICLASACLCLILQRKQLHMFVPTLTQHKAQAET